MSAAIERAQQPSALEILNRMASAATDPQAQVALAQSIVELQIKMDEHTWVMRQRQMDVDFDDALARCQSAIPQIKPDAYNQSTKSWWQRLETLDKVVRPIYVAEGFSLSFGEADCPLEGKIRTVARLSRGGITREYIKDMTPPTIGAKGNAVMSATHGDAAAGSYARRYLYIDIFNISKAISETDTDGNPLPPMDANALANCLNTINSAQTIQAVREAWKQGTASARDAKDDAATIQILKAYENAKIRFAREAK
jgi:hypothetical protein